MKKYTFSSLSLLVEEDNIGFIVSTTAESEKILGSHFYGYGKTKEEAEEKMWEMFQFIREVNEERSRDLDRWKFFQKGDWKHIGGTWFTLMGFHLYFRKGPGMQGGKYITWTKLNIMFTNCWRKKYVYHSQEHQKASN